PDREYNLLIYFLIMPYVNVRLAEAEVFVAHSLVMDKRNLTARSLNDVHAADNGIVIHQLGAHTGVEVIGRLLAQVCLREIVGAHVDGTRYLKEWLNGHARPIAYGHRGPKFQFVEAVIIDASFAGVRPSHNGFPIQAGAEVDKCGEILELRVGIAVAQIDGRHDASEEPVVLHHVIHLRFYLNTQSPQRIDYNGSDQVVGAEFGIVRKASGDATSFPFFSKSCQKSLTRLRFSNRFRFELVIVGVDDSLVHRLLFCDRDRVRRDTCDSEGIRANRGGVDNNGGRRHTVHRVDGTIRGNFKRYVGRIALNDVRQSLCRHGIRFFLC